MPSETADPTPWKPTCQRWPRNWPAQSRESESGDVMTRTKKRAVFVWPPGKLHARRRRLRVPRLHTLSPLSPTFGSRKRLALGAPQSHRSESLSIVSISSFLIRLPRTPPSTSHSPEWLEDATSSPAISFLAQFNSEINTHWDRANIT